MATRQLCSANGIAVTLLDESGKALSSAFYVSVRKSLNFLNAVSVLPVCTPHRGALMTGHYPTSTGMFLNDAHLPESELCMAEILSAAGYATAYIGKWHLDGHGRQSYIPPERRQGWQYWKAAECDHDYSHSHYYTGNPDVKQYWDGYDAFAQTKDAQQYLRDHSRNGQPFVLMVAYGVRLAVCERPT